MAYHSIRVRGRLYERLQRRAHEEGLRPAEVADDLLRAALKREDEGGMKGKDSTAN